jgi:hypothetical protein
MLRYTRVAYIAFTLKRQLRYAVKLQPIRNSFIKRPCIMTTRTIYILRYELCALNIARFIITKLKRITFLSDKRDIKSDKVKTKPQIRICWRNRRKKRMWKVGEEWEEIRTKHEEGAHKSGSIIGRKRKMTSH